MEEKIPWQVSVDQLALLALVGQPCAVDPDDLVQSLRLGRRGGAGRRCRRTALMATGGVVRNWIAGAERLRAEEADTERKRLFIGSDVEMSRRMWEDLTERFGRIVHIEGAFWRYGATHRAAAG